tara:strand:- start:321 stop:521 length:201 start_codon:yes stop_codon:yes gene_type:complete
MNHNEVQQYREDLKSRVVRIETIVERVEGQLSKLNNRTTSLEGWRGWMTGGMALLVVVITIAIGVL